MSIADLPNILTATDNKGGLFEFIIDDDNPIKVGLMWCKIQELVNHINDLEEKENGPGGRCSRCDHIIAISKIG